MNPLATTRRPAGWTQTQTSRSRSASAQPPRVTDSPAEQRRGAEPVSALDHENYSE